MSSSSTYLSIIIVSYNTREYLRRCLASISKRMKRENSGKFLEIIVVDNHSTDGSVEMVKTVFPKVRLLVNKENLGFAKANNQGFKCARGKFLMLLNSDTEFNEGSVDELLEIFKQEKLGAVGPQLLNSDRSFQPSCGFMPDLPRLIAWMLFIDDLPLVKSFFPAYHLQRNTNYSRITYVDWVSGACLVVRREVLEACGLLDENIFMYGEEVEWCYRIRKYGYQIAYFPIFRIIHHKGASGSGRFSGVIEEFRFIDYFYRKHHSEISRLVARLFLRFGALLRLLLFGIISGDSVRKSLYAKAIQVA